MVDNNTTSKPAPDAMRVKLRKLVDAVWNDVTESTAVPSTKWADKLIDLVFPSAPVPPPDGAAPPSDDVRNALADKVGKDIACTRTYSMKEWSIIEAALRSTPVADATVSEPVAWQNIDRIIDALEAAGCCRNGQVMASEDHVANTIRTWLRSLTGAKP